jgi:phospholipid/cholesterol/gamma-HCH transport system substrate-binding protein
MKRLKDYPPLWVGLIGGGMATVVVAAMIGFGSLGLTDNRYQAEFANTGGLRTGDEVRVAGIGVGEITDVELAGDKVLISFRAKQDVEIGARSTATIKLTTLLGGRFLDLRPRGGGELKDDRIPLANTEVPYNLQDVIQVGTPSLQKLDAVKLRKALKVLADDFRGTPQAFGESLTGLTKLSEVISKREDQVATLLTSADTITTELNENQAEIFALMGQTDGLLEKLLERRALLSRILTDFGALSDELSAVLSENRPQVEPLMKNLSGVTAILKRNDKHIDKALKLLAPGSRYVANATGNGPYLDVWLPYSVIPDNLLCAAGAVEGCK